jgi:hypothetical protein
LIFNGLNQGHTWAAWKAACTSLCLNHIGRLP